MFLVDVTGPYAHKSDTCVCEVVLVDSESFWELFVVSHSKYVYGVARH